MLAMERTLSTDDLSGLSLFRGENTTALEWVLEFCSYKELSAGDIILSPNQTNHDLYFILSGRAQIQLSWQGHKTLTYLEEGQCIGEMSIIERAKPSAIVIADTDCYLLTIKGCILWELIDRSHAVARNLIYMLSSRIRNDNNVIIESLRQQRMHEQKAKLDVLTGLNNRRWLDEMLKRIYDRYSVNHRPLSLVMLDVDHFKRYNDTHGHLAGDCALTSVANTIQSSIRPSDMAARFGGEEFVVILPDATLEEAGLIAQRLCHSVYDKRIIYHDKTVLPCVSVSVGVTLLQQGQSCEEFLANADVALYRAKEEGRNRVSIDESSISQT